MSESASLLSGRALSHAAAWSALVALLVGMGLPFHSHTDYFGAHTGPGAHTIPGHEAAALGHAVLPATALPAGSATSPAGDEPVPSSAAGHNTPASSSAAAGHEPGPASPSSPGDAHGGDCTLCEALRQVSYYFASAPVEPSRLPVSVFALRASQAPAPAAALLRGPLGRAPPRPAFSV